MEKKQIKMVLVVAAVIVFGIIWYWERAGSTQQDSEMSGIFESAVTAAPEIAAGSGKIYVHIVGAVKKPGVYTFDEKPRVVDVVEKAGGFAKDAMKSGINQAETVEDGSQIVIESKRDKKKGIAAGEGWQRAGQAAEDRAGLLNINTATKEELMTLTGIGESKAMSIIAYRDTNGKFENIEDIMKITGIKTGVFEKIKNHIRV